MQFRAQLVKGGGVRDNKMLFSGKTISQVQDVRTGKTISQVQDVRTCTLTNLYLVSEAPINQNRWRCKRKVKRNSP